MSVLLELLNEIFDWMIQVSMGGNKVLISLPGEIQLTINWNKSLNVIKKTHKSYP